MPIVTVKLWSGRSLEQKRALIAAITEAMVTHAGARRDALHVVLDEVDPENWGLAGVIGPDRDDVEPPAAAGPSAAPRIAHAALRVGDLERSQRFYCDLLGFGVRERGTFRDGEPLVSTTGGLGLIGAGESTTDHLAFTVSDLERLEARLRDEGVQILRGPITSEYGTSLYVLDPDGVEIELIEPTRGRG